MRNARQAVILSGGGGYAAYEVGVLKALFGPGSSMDAEIFSGTSAGAFNAAMMVSQPQAGIAETLEYLDDLWLNHLSLDKAACRQGAVRYRGDIFELFNFRCVAANPIAPIRDLMDDAFYFAQEFSARAAAFACSDSPMPNRLLETLDLT